MSPPSRLSAMLTGEVKMVSSLSSRHMKHLAFSSCLVCRIEESLTGIYCLLYRMSQGVENTIRLACQALLVSLAASSAGICLEPVCLPASQTPCLRMNVYLTRTNVLRSLMSPKWIVASLTEMLLIWSAPIRMSKKRKKLPRQTTEALT